MGLKAQSLVRLDIEPFNLIAVSLIEHFVCAPGLQDLSPDDSFRSFITEQVLRNYPDILAAILPAYEIKECDWSSDVCSSDLLSLQSHQFRSEHWTVVSGKAIVTVDDKTTEVLSGNAVYIPARSKHRIMNPSDEMLRIIEVQTGTYLGEDDIIRYEDDYGRNE